MLCCVASCICYQHGGILINKAHLQIVATRSSCSAMASLWVRVWLCSCMRLEMLTVCTCAHIVHLSLYSVFSITQIQTTMNASEATWSVEARKQIVNLPIGRELLFLLSYSEPGSLCIVVKDYIRVSYLGCIFNL